MINEHVSGAGGAGAPGTDGLAVQLGELARSLQSEDEEAILHHMVRAAIDLVPGAEEASISLVVGRRRIESRAPSSDLPRRVDALQSSTGQGPCLDAVYKERTVRVADMGAERRWPEFAQGALALGAASMLSFQLFVVGDTLGALNLYSRRANAFNEESEHAGLLVAVHAAVAFAEAQKATQLHGAMDSRDVIGQAKGILMERYKITADQAFVLLARVSSDTNVKLVRAAEVLADSGELPRRARADAD
jgi:transcriptional regulator with GAF, ATPase, and Fis domain